MINSKRYMTETNGSVRRRINARWGFSPKCITLLETSYDHNGLCNWVAFQVCGQGYETDLKDKLTMSNAYSDEVKPATLKKVLQSVEAITFKSEEL